MNKTIDQHVTKFRTAESVAEILIHDIRKGGHAVGSVLPTERALADRFGTTRPTIRAALMVMESRGFATLELGKRPRANTPSISGIFQSATASIQALLGDADSGAYLEQVRHFVEVGAVRVAAIDASNIQINQIRTALDDCNSEIGKGAGFILADTKFHRAIVSVLRNPIILEMHDRFVVALLSARSAGPHPAAQDRAIYLEHCQIFEAIVQSQPETAIDLMGRHLARSYRKTLLKAYRHDEGAGDGRF